MNFATFAPITGVFRMLQIAIFAMCSMTSMVDASAYPKVLTPYKCVPKSVYTRIERQQNLELVGTGFVKMSGANVPSLHFISNRRLDLKQAQELYLNVYSSVVAGVDRAIISRSEFCSLHFDEPPAKIMLSFLDRNERSISAPYLGFVSNRNGVIYYETIDGVTGEYKILHQEDAVTALAEYRESHPVCIEPQKTLWKTRGCRRH